jgi:hypothetical protein
MNIIQCAFVNSNSGECTQKSTILFWKFSRCIHDEKGKCSFWTANEKLKNGENPFL